MHSNLVYTSIVSKTLITPGCLSVLDLRTAFFANGSRDLFSRISSGANADSSNGRLPRNDVESDEYSFKGAARNQPENGFSFLGASKAKELFPLKAGGIASGGRDLFEGRLKGRTAPRKRAEDLFS